MQPGMTGCRWGAAAAQARLIFAVSLQVFLTAGHGAEHSAAAATGTLGGIDLLGRYPTKLTAGDTEPEHARVWEFSGADIFRLTRFHLVAGQDLRLEMGAADLGIGRCADGALWAVVIPREGGTLLSQRTNQEQISHARLRFHPATVSRLFPSDTVFADGATNLVSQMRRIANHKMRSSWQAGGRAMIPEPKDMTVDVDTKSGPRRFFEVNTDAGTAHYWAAFEGGGVRPLPLAT